jgi:hypothetical protein
MMSPARASSQSWLAASSEVKKLALALAGDVDAARGGAGLAPAADGHRLLHAHVFKHGDELGLAHVAIDRDDRRVLPRR